jgi:hypothetical protein
MVDISHWLARLLGRQRPQHPLPDDVRRTSHALANEVTSLIGTIRSFERHPNAIEELAAAMRGASRRHP